MRSVLVLGLSLLLVVAVQAHDSPEHSVQDLTEHMHEQGESVPLLLRRAREYRVLGHTEQAIADWQRVLEMEPDQQRALVELSRIHLAQNQFDTALQWIQKAIAVIKPGAGDTSQLYATRGDAYAAKADYANALKDYDRAISDEATQVDWYLNRSLMQELLDRPDDRIKGLSKGYEATRSAVLYTEWVEALIDGGQARRALRAIEPQLRQARLKSSWLIRRACARLSLNRKGNPSRTARDDLKTAIAEIDIRLNPARPDVDLLLDRALAQLLLGEPAAAHEDVALAKNHGAAPRQLERWRRLELRARM